MNTLLEVCNIKKYFKTKLGLLHAVDGLTLSIKQGKTLGIVGESGCGKSTLGRLIIRLIEPTSGKVIYRNENINNVRDKRMHELRKEMQIIFQDPFSSLDPRMCIYDTLLEPLKIYRLARGKHKIDKRIKEIMDIVGIEKRLERSYPHELDGGRRQRVGIARALVLEPAFIVCDEPVSALDVSIQAQILNLMKDLQEERGLTYMFITHDLSVVKHISDDICVMYLGKIVEKSSTKELFTMSLHPYTQALLSAIPVPDIDIKRKRIYLKGEISSPIEPEPGCRFAARCNYAEKQCYIEEPVLREVNQGHFVACHKYKV